MRLASSLSLHWQSKSLPVGAKDSMQMDEDSKWSDRWLPPETFFPNHSCGVSGEQDKSLLNCFLGHRHLWKTRSPSISWILKHLQPSSIDTKSTMPNQPGLITFFILSFFSAFSSFPFHRQPPTWQECPKRRPLHLRRWERERARVSPTRTLTPGAHRQARRALVFGGWCFSVFFWIVGWGIIFFAGFASGLVLFW